MGLSQGLEMISVATTVLHELKTDSAAFYAVYCRRIWHRALFFCYNKLQSPEEKRLKATASDISNDQMQPDVITASETTLPPGPTGI